MSKQLGPDATAKATKWAAIKAILFSEHFFVATTKSSHSTSPGKEWGGNMWWTQVVKSVNQHKAMAKEKES